MPGPIVIEEFKNDFLKAVDIINQYSNKDIHFGVFGSYARGDYNCQSDIDILAIWPGKPNTLETDYLYLDGSLSVINCQLTSVSEDYFNNSNDPFAFQLRRDFKEISDIYERLL